MVEPRIAIVCDGDRWYVRKIRAIEHRVMDGHDEMVYHCDEPISNDHPSLDDAVESAKSYVSAYIDGNELSEDA